MPNPKEKFVFKVAVIGHDQYQFDKPHYHVPEKSARFLIEKGICTPVCKYVIRMVKGAKIDATPVLLQGRREPRYYPNRHLAACEICGFSRFVERAHIIPSRFGGTKQPHNMLDLCPNHHKLFDRNALTLEEFNRIRAKVEPLVILKTADVCIHNWRLEIAEKYKIILPDNESSGIPKRF